MNRLKYPKEMYVDSGFYAGDMDGEYTDSEDGESLKRYFDYVYTIKDHYFYATKGK